MKKRVAYDDVVDLLDADHKAVKKMFMEHAALCDLDGPAQAKYALAQRICQALVIHAQLEEDFFYPAVRKAIDADDVMDEALEEHAQAKKAIAQIKAMKSADPRLDVAIVQLSTLIDQHVLQEREQIFLQARLAALDLRGMTLPLLKLQQQLKNQVHPTGAKESA